MTFYFDMDGTIADLYGVDNWLKDLVEENTRPYDEARPLIDCERLIKAINFLKAKGYNFGIISWTAKNGSAEYNKAVRKTKKAWLNKYFPNCFTEIHIVKYGTPKHRVAKDKGCLFDDEENNRIKWNRGKSYTEKDIFAQLEW